jgi:hypothetical protein
MGRLSKTELSLAMFRAEDEAVEYLGKYSPEVALAVARNVEEELAIKWKQEQREVMSRGGSRVIFPITEQHLRHLRFALTRIPLGVPSDAVGEEQILALLADLPTDRAWWVAHKVAHYQEAELKYSKHWSECEVKPDELAALPAWQREVYLAIEQLFPASVK